MSETSTRHSGPRGRGSGRGGGRGAFSNRGGRGGSRTTNGTQPDVVDPLNLEEEGEIGELKGKYGSKIGTIKELFPDWTEQDVAFALDETNGDLDSTVERISEGTISQWGEVKKKTKDRSVSKTKEPLTTSLDAPTSGTRGGRGRGGFENARGGRGRGTDRGRGAGRGARAAAGATSTNGPRSTKADPGSGAEPPWITPGTEPAAQVVAGNWDLPPSTAESTPLDSSWENVSAEAAQPSDPPKLASKPDGTRSWASMFAKPKSVPAPPKAPQAIPNHDALTEASTTATSNPMANDMQGLPPPIGSHDASEIPNTPPRSDHAVSEVPPSGDELTETNLEQVPDTSGPAASATAASTVASTLNPGTPLGGAQQTQASARPPMGGFATSAWKATGQPGRSASFQRKVLEQQEAVVMPGKHAVDRAAVQFGSMGLNGTPEDVDVDSDREDAETRTQPPQHSPVAPRASLPPAPQQQPFSTQPPATDPLPTPRQAPGLPPVGQLSSTQQHDQHLSGEQGGHSHPGSSGYPYNQFNDRYGSQVASTQKPYEPFGQQAPQPSQAESLPPSSQAGQPTSQSAFSSAGNDMSSFYTSDSQRNTYPNNFYGGYGQQPPHQGHDSARTGSAFGTSAPGQGAQYATSGGQQHSQSRFGQANELQPSGHSTPNASMSSQQPPNQSHHMMGQQQGQGHAGGQYGGYPGGYGHPYGAGFYSSYMNQMNQVSNHPYGRERPLFDDVRRYDDQYLTQSPQYGYGGSQGGYGSGPFGGAGGKGGGMYGQGHQGYGQSPYDQNSASPANSGAFGSQLPSSGRDSTTAGGHGSTYGRSGSAQPSDGPYSGAGGGNHGNAPDPFGARAQSGYQGHNQGLGSNIGQGGNDDSLRGYGGESKAPGGPSPALGQPGGRPGSTQGQSSSGPGGYSGYPSHANQGVHGQQGSQYGSGPSHQSGGQNQGAPYGASYGTGVYGGNYYGSSNRGGWGAGQNYGH